MIQKKISTWEQQGHMILNASHIGFMIMNASRMILHYQIQFCNPFYQFKKVDIIVMM